MRVYYNDSEPFVAAWLRNLIAAGHLPAGDVDERPIQEVRPDDVKGYTQAHFFAGIGGWPYALQLAGWGDRPVWTGSCPCQPFSAAGKRGSHADDRHLWPAWFDLIRQCRPVTVFGEQVSSAAGLGWLDAVALDLETLDYAVGACVLGAHSVGAPHHRQRLWYVADATGTGRCGVDEGPEGGNGRRQGTIGGSGAPALRNATESRLQQFGGLEQSQAGDTGWGVSGWESEPDVGRVAHGIPARVGRLRAYGNAIVPETAAAFVTAYLECQP